MRLKKKLFVINVIFAISVLATRCLVVTYERLITVVMNELRRK